MPERIVALQSRLTATEAASDTMSPEDADRMERAAIALEGVNRTTDELRGLLAELVPPDIELACDECGGVVSKLCPPTCTIRRARALLGQPHQDYNRE